MLRLGFLTPFLLAVLLVVFNGCTKSTGPSAEPNQGALDAATAAMDRGDYDEALATLKRLLVANPDDAKAHMLLSNVYVKQAGVEFTNLIPLAEVYAQQAKEKSNDEKAGAAIVEIFSSRSAGDDSKAAKAIEKFRHLISTLDAVVLIFDKIPDVTEADHDRLTDGIDQAVQSHSARKGDILYRAFLQIIDLKYSWKHGDAFRFMDADCKVVPSGLYRFLNGTFKRYETIATDLKTVYPNLAPSLDDSIAKYKAIAPQLRAQLGQLAGDDDDGDAVKSVWQCL